ncbi:MAG TPA: ABC transporter permease subunit [Candidatus Limnocylindrales bacterium]|jgi:osmoprotectant transport system permease protein
MELLREVADWFADPARWTGTDGIPNRLVEHVTLSGLVVVAALAIALPIGLYIGHTGRAAIVAIGAANLGRAVPSYALLLVFFPFFGLGFGTAFPALLLLAIPPILTNTYVGLRDVDRDTVEAARGMGMTEWQLLRGVELPIALPVIVAGIRTSAVQVVATATLAALVAGGGLGRYIVDGFALQDDGRLIGGAVLVALLALATERVLTLVERRLVSPGLRGGSRPGGQAYEMAGQAPAPVTTGV